MKRRTTRDALFAAATGGLIEALLHVPACGVPASRQLQIAEAGADAQVARLAADRPVVAADDA